MLNIERPVLNPRRFAFIRAEEEQGSAVGEARVEGRRALETLLRRQAGVPIERRIQPVRHLLDEPRRAEEAEGAGVAGQTVSGRIQYSPAAARDCFRVYRVSEADPRAEFAPVRVAEALAADVAGSLAPISQRALDAAGRGIRQVRI